jgi:prepilin-type N-terminal cleavage/methylation domain-containing protein/prepilin-type processing-associated H-X9-DG protein
MKTSGSKSAFTLIELLVVIFVVAVLFALLLPAGGGHGKAMRIVCAFNLKNINDSFVAWSQRHDGKLPMQVSATDGGTLEFIQSGSAAVHFLALTNSGLTFVHNDIDAYSKDGRNFQKLNSYTNYGIETKWLACLSDRNRWGAIYLNNSLSGIVDTNISYFVGVDAMLNNPKSILAGDRHLQVNGVPANPGLLVLTLKSQISWSEELHHSKSSSSCNGNILFADGHVEFLNTKGVGWTLRNQNTTTNRLAIP